MRGIRCCPLRRDTPIVVGENPEPAAAVLSCLFERNNIHLPPGVTELYFGEPVRCTSFLDEGCRHRSVRQHVQQEGSLIVAPARGLRYGRRRRSPFIQSFK